jgi:predicted DNA-binding antitoxin AbrB/MazE fold protein
MASAQHAAKQFEFRKPQEEIKMMERVRAVYQNGAFIPQARLDLPEEAEVELTVQAVSSETPQIGDDEQRARLLQAIVRNMQNNPIPAQSPKFTREELHARG